MAKLKKRTPVKPPPELERNIQQIYDDINEIINRVNLFDLGTNLDERGDSVGTMRMIKIQQQDKTNKYYLRIKTDEGWVQVETTEVG